MKKSMFAGALMIVGLSLTAMAQPNTPVMRDAHALVFGNAALARQVEEVPGGVKTTTTTTNPDLLPVLRRHPREMYQRYADGGMVRRWDPLFVELAKVHDQIQYEVRDIDGGVEVVSTSNDPNVTRLIRAHAAKVSAMQEQGAQAMRAATPLPNDYQPSDKAAPGVCCPAGGPRGAVQQGQARRYDGRGNRRGYTAGGGQGQGQGQGMGQMRRGQGQGKGMNQMQRGQGQGKGMNQMQRGQGQGKGMNQMQRGQGQGRGQGMNQMQRGQGQGRGQGMGRMQRGQGQGQCQGAGCGW